MRTSITLIVGVAALLFPVLSNAKPVGDPGGGFVGQKQQKLGKNYYIVRKENGCAIQASKKENKPEGVIGDAPYASKGYAKAALKTFPECKGGLVDDDKSSKKNKKDKDSE